MTNHTTNSFNLLSCFAIVLALLFSPVSNAQQWYHVEVLVFKNLNGMTDEMAPDETVPGSTYTPDSNAELMKPANVESLTDSARRLNKASAYQVLYHRAWQQPIALKADAKSVEISNNKVFGRVRLHKGTYLYATVDLQLQELTASGLPYLQQAQRVRSNKTHYFDHPQLGALLRLTPIDN